MDAIVLVKCGIGLLLVILNGFFVLVEFALVRARPTRLELLKRGGSRTAGLALEMQRKLDRYLSACQLGITVASLGLGWVGEPAFAALLAPLLDPLDDLSGLVSHSVSLVTAFVLITALHIVLGELVPKSIGISKAEPAILASAKPMYIAYILFYTPLTALNAVSNAILKLLGIPPVAESEAAVSDEELRLVLGRSQREGAMSLAQVLLCENVLDLKELDVRSIHVPIEQVAVLDIRKPWSENMETVLSRRFSRYPVCDGNPSVFTGFVHLKEVMMGQMRHGREVDLSLYRRDLPKVDADASLESILPVLQRLPTNMFQVADRSGKTLGIVTFEDLLEELIGEIADEFEAERTWRLGDFMEPAAVVMDLKASDLAGAVRELASLLPSADQAAVATKLPVPEVEMLSYAGKGMALPRMRLKGLPRTAIAYGRSSSGLVCRAQDHKPVRHVFLILTPLENPREQLRALARISVLFSGDILSAGFHQAETASEVLDIIRAADQFTPLEMQNPELFGKTECPQDRRIALETRSIGVCRPPGSKPQA